MERDAAFLWETETLRARRATPARASQPLERAPAEWVTLREASDDLGVATTTLRNWAKKGKVPGQLVEGRWLISLGAARRRASATGRSTSSNRADRPPPPVTSPEANRQEPPATMLVPIDAWDRMLAQLGNLHEAGQQLAEARERAAKAETEARFLREQLAELRNEDRDRQSPPRATADEVGAPSEPSVPEDSSGARRRPGLIERLAALRRRH